MGARNKGLLLAACVLVGVVALGGLVAAPESGAPLWDQWRGPARNGTTAGTAWPNSLQGEHLVTKWHVPLGGGYSGPIVAADRVFVLETTGAESEGMRAFDRATGRQLWKAEWRGGTTVRLPARSRGSFVKSTPAYDGERVYAAGMSEVLVCLNAATGAILWSCDFPKLYGTKVPGFGCVSSPLVVGEHVYMQAANSFIKLDKRTGVLVWRTLIAEKVRILTDDGGEASPVFAVIQKQPQLVVQARSGLHGVEPEHGRVLWTQQTDAFMDNDILTPTVLGDYIFTACQKGGVSLYYIRRVGVGFGAQTVWHQSRPSGYMSSPVVVGERGYLYAESSRLACINLRTGEAVYTSKPFGPYWSMATQGDEILALDGDGELILLRANASQFELLDRRKISDQETWGHVAVCGDQIFVREKEGLLALQWR
jgi:outer membrane protein assembly factor BamB